jgi:hypothetical protein
MKIFIALLSVFVTANSFGASLNDASAVTTILPYATSATTVTLPKLQAAIVLNDAQEAMQSGKVSTFLAQKIKDVQTSNSTMSESDALEIVIADAQEILN